MCSGLRPRSTPPHPRAAVQMVVGRGSTRAAAEAELAGAERRSPRAHEGSPEQVTVQDATELATDVDAPFICLFRSRGWTDAPLFQLKKSSRKGAELTGEATANRGDHRRGVLEDRSVQAPRHLPAPHERVQGGHPPKSWLIYLPSRP